MSGSSPSDPSRQVRRATDRHLETTKRRAGQYRAADPMWKWPPGSVVLGRTSTGKAIYVPADMRALGMHIPGLSGGGKSSLAELMLRQDYLEMSGVSCGALAIDPHGTLIKHFMSWYVSHGLHQLRPVRILKAGDPKRVFHLNPLHKRPGVDPAVIATAVTNAVLRVWGGEEATATPQLRETLKCAFTALVELGLSINEAGDLLDPADASGLRAYATAHVSNPVVRRFLRSIDALRIGDREVKVGSASRRLNEFLLPERVRLIFSDPDRWIDWRQVMDQGEFVLLDLSYDGARLSEDEAQLIGTMILAEIFLATLDRSEESIPFYVYIDECHRYLTKDIVKLFSEGRKFNCSPVLLHQDLGQIRMAGDFVHSAVMTARTKIVFGGLDDDDATFMARNIFRGQFDLQKAKDRYNKPVVIGQELIELLSESDSHGTARATGTTDSHGGSQSTQHSTTTSKSKTKSKSDTIGDSDTSSNSTTNSHSTTYSESDTTSESETISETDSTSETETSSHSDGHSSGRGYSEQSDYWALMPKERSSSYDDSDTTTDGESSTSGSTHSETRSHTTGHSHTSGVAHTTGTAHTTGRAHTDSRAHTDGTAKTKGVAHTTGGSSGSNWSHGRSTTDTVSDQHAAGRSQGLGSVFQVMPTTPWSLDELIHVASVRLAHLKRGEAIVKIGTRPAARIRTLRIADGWARPEHIERITDELSAAVPYITKVEEAVANYQQLQRDRDRLIAASPAKDTANDGEEEHAAPPPLKDPWG